MLTKMFTATPLPTAASSGDLGEDLWILVWLPVGGLQSSPSGDCAAELPGMHGCSLLRLQHAFPCTNSSYQPLTIEI